MSDTVASSKASPRRAGSQAWWNAVNAWLLLLPAAVLLIAFTHYPILATVRHSLFITRPQWHRGLCRPRQLSGYGGRPDLLEGAGQ
ncbi:ABC-type sugar transport system permease subunit [Bradyrhizobium sp. LM6.11]